MEIRKIKNAKEPFKQAIVKHDCPPQFLHNDDINYETLRRARVHLDMTVNVMFRFAFKGFDFETTWFYLFADASPQQIGVEL